MCNLAYLCTQSKRIKKMNKLQKNGYFAAASACILLIIALVFYYFFTSFSSKAVTVHIYIDNDDNIDSVLSRLTPVADKHSLHGFRTLVRHSNYTQNIRTGRYDIKPGDATFSVFRRLKNGLQTPVDLTVVSVRTVDRLAGELSKQIMVDSAALSKAFHDQTTCQRYGYDTATIAALFIPNTYTVYWNTSVDKLMERMKKENEIFWKNNDRTEKARRLHLSTVEVSTLASIIDEETANDNEKPMIAGMYYNRLTLRSAEYPAGMPLQADPTVKFAAKQFELRRIYNKLLRVKNPYNTYVYTGLPPGPIRIASVSGIDAVLDMVHHDYLYMCAKEDFSGTHNFSRTYQEHLANAAKYSAALNSRGIK